VITYLLKVSAVRTILVSALISFLSVHFSAAWAWWDAGHIQLLPPATSRTPTSWPAATTSRLFGIYSYLSENILNPLNLL
jgi:hypothetical protein